MKWIISDIRNVQWLERMSRVLFQNLTTTHPSVRSGWWGVFTSSSGQIGNVSGILPPDIWHHTRYKTSDITPGLRNQTSHQNGQIPPPSLSPDKPNTTNRFMEAFGIRFVFDQIGPIGFLLKILSECPGNLFREHSIFAGVLTKTTGCFFSRTLADRRPQPWLTPPRGLNALLRCAL